MRPLTTLVALAACLAAAIVPSTPASADVVLLDVYCVEAQSCPAGGETVDLLSLALKKAADDPGPGKIVLGPRPGGFLWMGPFTYDNHGVASNYVAIEGQGGPWITTGIEDTAALTLHGKDSEVGGVRVLVPTSQRPTASCSTAPTPTRSTSTAAGRRAPTAASSCRTARSCSPRSSVWTPASASS